MSDRLEAEVCQRLRTGLDEWKKGLITKEEFRAILFREAGILEQDEWRIINDLRTRAPESERELARVVADLLEAKLRKGSGRA
jgi:hypothetical protein